MDIAVWSRTVADLLVQLPQRHEWIPAGHNTLHGPASKLELAMLGTVLTDQTALAFYRHCDGLSWPDVSNGYFLHPIPKITAPCTGTPRSVEGTGRCLVTGSDGGGGLFCLDARNAVAYLPNARVAGGVYYPGAIPVTYVAPSFEAFLDQLLKDLRALVEKP